MDSQNINLASGLNKQKSPSQTSQIVKIQAMRNNDAAKNFYHPIENIESTKRKRLLNTQSKWKGQDKIKYCYFYVEQICRFPRALLIEYSRKKEGIFLRMAKFLGKSKRQCKSYDQQIRKKYQIFSQESFLIFLRQQLKQDGQINRESIQKLQDLDDVVKENQKIAQQFTKSWSQEMKKQEQQILFFDKILREMEMSYQQ